MTASQDNSIAFPKRPLTFLGLAFFKSLTEFAVVGEGKLFESEDFDSDGEFIGREWPRGHSQRIVFALPDFGTIVSELINLKTSLHGRKVSLT